MYAVLETGGKQYKVSPGNVLRVEKIEAEKGATVELGNVRLVQNDAGLILDPKKLEKATVRAEVVRQGRAKKVIIFKKKRRKGYRRTRGHRQSFTEVRVTEISCG